MKDVLDVGIVSAIGKSNLDGLAPHQQGQIRLRHDYIVFSRHLQNHPELVMKRVIRLNKGLGKMKEYYRTMIIADESGIPFKDMLERIKSEAGSALTEWQLA